MTSPSLSSLAHALGAKYEVPRLVGSGGFAGEGEGLTVHLGAPAQRPDVVVLEE